MTFRPMKPENVQAGDKVLVNGTQAIVKYMDGPDYCGTYNLYATTTNGTPVFTPVTESISVEFTQ